MRAIGLNELAEQLLALARAEPGGRVARTVHGDCNMSLRQMVVAWAGGRHAADYQAGGDATVQVIRGRLRITVAGVPTVLKSGDLVDVPPQPHSVEALEDSVLLVTVDVRS